MFYNVQGPDDHGPPYKVHKKDMNFYFVSFEGTTLSSVLPARLYYSLSSYQFKFSRHKNVRGNILYIAVFGLNNVFSCFSTYNYSPNNPVDFNRLCYS